MSNITLEEIENRKKRVERKLSGVHNLPSLPFIIFEVTKLIDDPDTSAAELGEFLSRDQGLVTKILTVANSPLYGIPRRVATIDFAIMVLGFNHIKNIVIALSMMENLKVKGGSKFDQRKFWVHSFMTATASKKISDDLGFHATGEAFTIGLLHDLGIPIIYKYFNKEYEEIIKLTENENYTFLKAEEEVLGVTHAEIGAHLLERWNLPTSISKVVNFHHKPSIVETNEKTSASVIHLADYMTNKLNIGSFLWDKDIELDENIIEILNLGSKEYLESFMVCYKEIFDTQLETLNL